jgi:5'-methylthioadenosine phosphorylase
MSSGTADVGVIGGSGFYRYLEDATEVVVDTPYGSPSSLALGHIDGRGVAFIARHGLEHTLAPHRINYRANLWALREMGVRRVIAPCAVGSLRHDLSPGELVVCDQLVDRTWGRADTFLDGPVVNHVAFADPYCAELGSLLADAAATAGVAVHRGGTVVVIQGPRFSTRAESTWFRSAGWDLVGMTQYPEAVLARELGLCYAGIAMVTDYDTGIDGGEPGGPSVTMAGVMEVLAANVEKARRVLTAAIGALPPSGAGRTCACSDSEVSGPSQVWN